MLRTMEKGESWDIWRGNIGAQSLSSPGGKNVPWEVERGMCLAGEEVMKVQINQVSKHVCFGEIKQEKALGFLFLARELSS